jgi:hypothetical protein
MEDWTIFLSKIPEIERSEKKRFWRGGKIQKKSLIPDFSGKMDLYSGKFRQFLENLFAMSASLSTLGEFVNTCENVYSWRVCPARPARLSTLGEIWTCFSQEIAAHGQDDELAHQWPGQVGRYVQPNLPTTSSTTSMMCSTLSFPTLRILTRLSKSWILLPITVLSRLPRWLRAIASMLPCFVTLMDNFKNYNFAYIRVSAVFSFFLTRSFCFNYVAISSNPT